MTSTNSRSVLAHVPDNAPAQRSRVRGAYVICAVCSVDEKIQRDPTLAPPSYFLLRKSLCDGRRRELPRPRYSAWFQARAAAWPQSR